MAPPTDMGSTPRSRASPSSCGAVGDLPGLVRAVKEAWTGDGSVEHLIDSAAFDVSSREFTRLITACRGPRQWRKAIEILEFVKRRGAAGGVHMNFFVYSAAISVCCRSGRVKEALGLLEEMKNAAATDSSMAPDSVVYKLLVAACMRNGKHRQVVGLFWECVDLGLEQDDQTLQHTLKALIHLKDWKVALDVLDKLHSRWKCLRVEEYNEFIACCRADGRLEVVTELLLTMQMVGVLPNVETCNLVFLSILEAGHLDLGLEFVETVSSCDSFSNPKAVQACQKACRTCSR